MRAIRQYEFGAAETLRYEEVPDLVPGPGQVRLTVEASGVHLVDTAIRSGDTDAHPFGKLELPMTPGREVAGTVDGVGSEVDDAWLGQRVVTHLGITNGGYAEAAVREVDAVHIIPDSLSPEVAVAMIGTGRTAVGILEAGKLTAGDVVLVPAAAGGIGSLLVQAARAAGATVVGLAGGPAKTDRVAALAADIIAVDYRSSDWQDEVVKVLGGQQPTVVFDGVGGQVGGAALELLGVGGRFIIFGWSAGEVTQLTADDLVGRGLTADSVLGPRMLNRPGGLRGLETEALAAASSGPMVPPIHHFALKDAWLAHEALTSRDTIGKVVLQP